MDYFHLNIQTHGATGQVNNNYRTVYPSSTIREDVSKHKKKQLAKKSVNTPAMLSNVVISSSPQHTYTARQVQTATDIWPLMIGVIFILQAAACT